MYSMVLMMALTTGAEAPAWGHGCCGGYTVSSCCGGCCGGTVVSSCCGGCCGGSSSCCGGCCGGGHKWFSGFSGFSLFHHGCCGGYSSCCGGTVVSSGCCGGTVVSPVIAPAMPAPTKIVDEPKKEEPKKEDMKKEEKKEGAAAPAPATILVSLPADAKLSIDDASTASTSANRRFLTPTLESGKDFTYTLKAVLVRDGQTVIARKVVTVRAGETSNVEIEVPAISVAAK